MAAKRRLAGHVGVPISDPSDIDDERDSRLSPPANVERNRKTLSLEVHEPPQEPTDDGFVQPQAPKRTRDELVSAKIQEMQSTEVTGFLIKPDFASHRPLQDRMIMRLPFARTVRDISAACSGRDDAGQPRLRWHIDALNALHEAAETYIVELYQDGELCSRHAGRATLFREDIQLVKRLRGLDRGPL